MDTKLADGAEPRAKEKERKEAVLDFMGSPFGFNVVELCSVTGAVPRNPDASVRYRFRAHTLCAIP
jgi:hypothetical protein